MSLKVYGEHTRPTDGQALCGTCRAATRVMGSRFGDDFVRCGVMEQTITFRVVECSAYQDNRLVPFHELEQTAWRYLPDIERWVSPAEFMHISHARYERPGWWQRVKGRLRRG